MNHQFNRLKHCVFFVALTVSVLFAQESRDKLKKSINAYQGHLQKSPSGQNFLSAPQMVAFDRMKAYVLQTGAFAKLSGDTGLVDAPTGWGKTILQSKFIEAAIANNKGRALVLVPFVESVEDFNSKLLASTSFTQNDVSLISSLNLKKDFSTKRVTITTYQSFVNGVKSGAINPKTFDLVMADEAELSSSELRTDALSKLGHAIRFGFSASPAYSKGKGAFQSFHDLVFARNIVDAVEQDAMLTNLKVLVAEYSLDLSSVELGGLQSQQDYQQASLGKLLT